MNSFGDKAKSVIASVAPTLGSVLLGPLGGRAGAALSKALGSDDPKIQEEAIAAASPETLLKLKEAENELQEHLKQLDIDAEKLRFDDTANARAREIATHDLTPRILAFFVVTLVLIAEGGMFFFGAPTKTDPVVLGRILGTLDSALILVLQYYFGSSSGSAAKTDALSALASKAAK